jgi:hypothetical protein
LAKIGLVATNNEAKNQNEATINQLIRLIGGNKK